MMKDREKEVKEVRVVFRDIAAYPGTLYAPDIKIAFKKEHWWQ